MLHVHRAERADGLVTALRSLLATPPADPFAPEVVAVPTRGMERWLTQQLATCLGASPGRADGVCANVAFPPPRRILGDAVAAASGILPAADPWLPERAVWPLLELLDGCLQEPWCAPLAAHLGGAGDGADPARRARRFAAVRHVADLLDRYALHRPELLRRWAQGEDGGWQAEFFRRLCDRLAEPDPARRLDGACRRLRDEPELADLPDRLALFGLTRLPAGHLAVLQALAHRRDVHLFLLHPSPALWDAVARSTAGRPPVVRRAADPTATLPASRLLASWGQDAREMQLVLQTAGAHVEHHHGGPGGATTLLGRLQADIRADRPPPGLPLPGGPDARPALDPADRSVQVHACHGRARQVEVVRDAIGHLLAEDETLEPRDVIVMCPDIEAFAPLVGATFGAGGSHGDGDEAAGSAADAAPPGLGLPDLRVRLADRSARRTNPVLGVVAALIDLASGRLTASQVLDFAGREPVRRRFQLDDDELERAEDLVASAGVRWGLDAEHRRPFKLAAVPAGTWRAGLDRVLVGVTMTEEDLRLFGDVLPLDDVGGDAIDLAGRLAELVDRLRAAVDDLGAPKPVDAWARAISRAADALTATAPGEEWQRAGLERLLDAVVAEATSGGTVSPTPLALAEVRALLADRLAGRATRAGFRTGHLTVCTLMPMRSVPHRVVCLLGLDDGAFPRRAPRDGDDLMLDDPQVGDRDPRAEDRQLLLDALIAATDRLVITYTGNDERTNAPRPPAVPVGELLDVVDRTVRAEGGAARQVLVRHPLQPFDPRGFAPGGVVPGRVWSFDRVMLEGAEATTAAARPSPRRFLAAPLPARPAPVVALEDLVRFVAHPVRAFLRQRLGIGVPEPGEEPADALPVELDGLARWRIGQRLLEARLAGVERRATILAELRRGSLPPGVLGKPVVEDVEPVVDAIVAAALALVPGDEAAASVDVRVRLDDGRLLGGTVSGVTGHVLRTVTYARVAPRHRLASWTRLLALTAARPERPFEAVTVGRASAGRRPTAVRIPPLAPDPERRRALALGHLGTLLDLHGRGLCEPLPVACRTSAAYAAAAAAGGDAPRAAAAEWASTWDRAREDADPEHVLVLGGVRPFAELLAAAPRPDEGGPGWDPAEVTRFGRYARRLWDGLLACEEEVAG